jgi:acyl-CoA thioester hydrolase
MSFKHKVRVYWEDTDAGGIVFYANYLKFLERARTEWLRSLGIGQHKLKTDLGGMFVVSETHMKYLAPAVLDDELEIHTFVTEKGRTSLTLEQKAYRLNAPPLLNDNLQDEFSGPDNYNVENIKKTKIDKVLTNSNLTLLCTGMIRIGWINVQSGRPTRIPGFIQEIL